MMPRSEEDRAEPLNNQGNQAAVKDYGNGTGAGVPSLPPGMSSAPSAGALLRSLKRRWVLALVVGVTAAALSFVAAWYLIPIKYTAKTTLYIASRKSTVLDGDQFSPDAMLYQRTQAALVKSRFVWTATLRMPGVSELELVKRQPDMQEWFDAAITTDFKQSPELLTINMSGDRPEDLRILLDALVAAYMEEVVRADEIKQLEKISKIKDVSVRYEQQLAARRRAYRDLAESLGNKSEFAAVLQQQFAQERLGTVRKELIALKSRLRTVRVGVDLETAKQEKKGADVVIPDEMIDEQLDKDRTVLSFLTEIEKMETKRDKAAPFYGPDSRPAFLKRENEKIDKVKQALLQFRQGQREKMREHLAVKERVASQRKLHSESEQLVLLKELDAQLTAEVEKLGGEIKAAAVGTIDLEGSREDLEKVGEVARKLRTLVEHANVEAGSPPRILVKDKADVRLAQAEKRQLLIAGGAAGGALLVVLAIIAYLEFLTRRVNTGDDVVYGLGWRLVGALPALPAPKGRLRRARDDKYWHSILTESVDATRTILLHAARTEGVRTIMVTSAVSGEGKTSLSCHLATSLARAGRKTLLIDCDLRSPAAHRLFELPGDPGVSELLRSEVEDADVIRATPANNLWLMPAGECDAQTLQVLAQDGLAPILDRLKEQFDFIVVDSSPVLPVTDALLIGQNVDVVIFSLLRDVSRIPNVYAAYQRLSSLGIRMLGAVVNGVTKGAYGYTYQDYARQTN